MQKIKLNPFKPKINLVKHAAQILQNGGLIVCPTETVYIFAADATNEEAIRKIYTLKNREAGKPIHVIAESLGMAQNYGKFTRIALKLEEKFLPGPITLVVEKVPDKLPDLLTGSLPTIGIRIPPVEFNTMLARELGKPYTATSANKSASVNTYTVDDVLSQLTENDLLKIDLILDAGPLPQLPPSTIIDTTTTPPKILREGPISRLQIENELGIKVE